MESPTRRALAGKVNLHRIPSIFGKAAKGLGQAQADRGEAGLGQQYPVPDTGPYASDAAIVKLNEIAAGVMKTHNIPIDDLYGFAKPRIAEFQIPGDCHFKEDKYELFGQPVAQSILEALKH